MAKEKAKSAVVVTPKVAKITKSDITNAILAQSLETKVDLLSVSVNSDSLNKLTKESLIEIVKVVNPKFEVLKKTTKGEIIPVIMKADEKFLSTLANSFFNEGNLMKQTKEFLETIVAAINVPATETEETPAAETATEDAPTPTDAVITDESSEVVADETATKTTDTVEA
jgi:hypothetical protein